LASTVHVPTEINVNTLPLVPDDVQTRGVADVNVTGFGDPPPVAVAVYANPDTLGLTGVDVMVIACGSGGIHCSMSV
jgi:hypothetical protein